MDTQQPTTPQGITSVATGFKWLLSALLFLGLSCGVPYLIYERIGAESLSLLPRVIHPLAFTGIAVLLVIYFTSDALRLYYVFKVAGHRLDAGSLAKLTFMNILFSNVTPMATGGGFVQVWYLSNKGVPIGTATAATTIRTFIAMLLIFLPIPLLVAFLPNFREGGIMGGAGWILACVAMGYLLFFLVMLFRIKWLLAILDLMAKGVVRSRLVSAQRMQGVKFRWLRESVRFSRCLTIYFQGERRAVFLSIFFTAIFLLSLFSFPYLLFVGAGYHPDYLTTAGLLTVSTCIMYFAPSPGGAGFAEGVFGLFFASMVDPSDLVGIMIMWRFLTIYLGMLIGIPVTLHELVPRRG
ncbi:lysylphosphatidylglycerol synthase transmembrane domain-containing protein [Desulfoplanes sp. PS50]